MKLQISGQALRFRIDETELAALLSGAEVVNRTVLGDATQFVQALQLVADEAAALDCTDGQWRLRLPRAGVEAYAARLPCRDGLDFRFGPLQATFEVDVRDSARKRLGGGRG